LNFRRIKAAMYWNISTLRAEIEAADADLRHIRQQEKERTCQAVEERERMAVSRKAASGAANNGRPGKRRKTT
jgi:hypothetical protein